jgi:hypothetical protein
MRVAAGVDMPVRHGRTFVRIHLLYSARGGPWIVSDNAVSEPVEGGDVHGAFERCAALIAERYRVAVPIEADPSRDQTATPTAIVRRRRERVWN